MSWSQLPEFADSLNDMTEIILRNIEQMKIMGIISLP